MIIPRTAGYTVRTRKEMINGAIKIYGTTFLEFKNLITGFSLFMDCSTYG